MKPCLYMYCQHSVGMGHLVRSVALARALTAEFRVHMLSGGQPPSGFVMPPDVSVHHLPALGMEDSQLVSLEAGLDVDAVKHARLAQIDALLRQTPPDMLVTELYPFGRKKFAFEIDRLIAVARTRGAPVVSSVRDLLVAARADQQRHDDRAAGKLNADYDAVVVHADPAFARLEETFQPSVALRTPVHYSGFVIPNPPASPRAPRERRVIVSAGGGIVGGGLFHAAVAMQREAFGVTGMPMTLVAGPFLPEDEWRELQETAQGVAGLTLMRSTPDLCAVMTGATHSISQFGYNTAIDIMVAGVAAVVVPFAAGRETEQTVRALRLAGAGLVAVVPETDLTPARLAAALGDARPPDSPLSYALDGAQETARILARLCPRPISPKTSLESAT